MGTSRRVLRASILGLALAVAAPGKARAAGDDPVDLLRLPRAERVATTALGADAGSLAALTDGDPGTAGGGAADARAPLDLVFAFGDGSVSPERLRVVLPGALPPEAAPGTVEVLVSTVSPHAGFRSLRLDPLKPGAKPQEFAFPPAEARWILLRFTPGPKATRVAVATVELLGHEGPPRSRYAFAESPARALDVLGRLRKFAAVDTAVTAEEGALFARAAKGPLDAAEFAEAALISCGVADAAKRREYLRRIDDLEREARRAVAGAAGTEKTGEALLRWLHAGPMSKGYVAGQTDLTAVLDTGKFNCVSSATLYNVLAVRLGLDARAIEVPDHAFSIVYDGTRHMDVETTTPDGFHPSRNPAAVAEFERATGFRYIPDAHRDRRREVGAAGLVAITYYNHGVALGEAKRYPESLGAYFRAMSLDPESASAVKNALSVLANWTAELADRGSFEEALDVAATGLALAPEDAALRNNRTYAWSAWARRLAESGKPDEALAVLRRADQAVPDGGFLAMQAWVFLKPAEEHARAGRWAEALAAAEAGLPRLEGKPLEEVQEYRRGIHVRRFGAAVEAKDFETAAKAVDDGLALAPEDHRVLGNAGYLVQEWTQAVLAREGASRALEVGRTLRARWPANPRVAEALANHVRRSVYALAEGGKPEEALAAADAGKDAFAKPSDLRDVRAYVWDGWAKRLVQAGDWEGAAGVYARALADLPDVGLLVNNVAFLAQEWSRAAYAKGGDAAVADVSRRLAELFPGVAAVTGAGAKQVRRAVEDLVKAGRWEEAVKALQSGSALLGSGSEARDTAFFLFDRWARALYGAGDWEGAAAVYARAVELSPGDGRFRGNIGYLTQEWAAAAQKAGGAERALAALRTMRERFPSLEEVARATRAHVGRTVAEIAQAGRYEEALAALATLKPVLPKAEDEVEAARTVYDHWASARQDAKDWQGAVDVYAKALAAWPKDRHLTHNAVVTWDAWARTYMDTKAWDRAIEVYDRALERFPDDSHLKGNRAYAVQQRGK